MEILIKAARISYGMMLAGLGIQQIIYADFRPVILPPWQLSFPGHVIVVYIAGAALVLAGLAINLNKKASTFSLILGGILLLIFISCQIPYEIFADPNHNNLGAWTSALKELAIAGGCFVIGGSFPVSKQGDKNMVTGLLEKIIPFGSIFFCIMLIIFGIDHFLYTAWIGTLVPNWIPGHIFWTYFAGVALIGSGVTIILRIQVKLSALLLAAMIFIWFIILHIPRAIADPYSLQGNEISSVLESFGFSGVAYLMAYGYEPRPEISHSKSGEI